MDNLTHTAVGLFLSRIGLKRWSPLATPILLVASNIPDLDIVTAAGGSLSYLHFHRHLTHALVALPFMALLSVALVRLIARKPVQWRGAFFASLIAVAAHLLLDFTNVYGIRLLLPFSARWLRLDTTNVFDLIIWAVFVLCLLGPLVSRLVGSEITSSSRRDPNHGRGFAWLALLFILAYDCGRGVLHARAIATLETRLYQEQAPVRIAALPGPANPLQWRGLIETADYWIVADFNLVQEFDPTHATVLYKAPPDPAIDAANRTPAFQEFLRFSQFPLWRVQPSGDVENGKLVELLDLRFGTPSVPGFMATALLDSRLQPIRSSFQWGISRSK